MRLLFSLFFIFSSFFVQAQTFFLDENSLRQIHFCFCRTSPAIFSRGEIWSYVCGGFNENKAMEELPWGFLSLTAKFSHLFQNVSVAPAPLTICSKPSIEPHSRCSCEMCGTSAVPLLVISETSIKTS